MKIKNRFNLIEITLAMAVLAVGMTGVMALFPVGFKANSDSIATNNAVLVANKIYSIIKASKSSNWNQWFFNPKITVPDHRPGTLYIDGTKDGDAAEFGDISGINGDTPYNAGEPASKTSGPGPDPFGIYGVDAPKGSLYPGLLYAQLTDGASDMPTFQAHIRIWWTSVKRAEIIGTANQLDAENVRWDWDGTRNAPKAHTLLSSEIVGVHMEVSWPTNLPWEKRNFRHFYFEISKLN